MFLYTHTQSLTHTRSAVVTILSVVRLKVGGNTPHQTWTDRADMLGVNTEALLKWVCLLTGMSMS